MLPHPAPYSNLDKDVNVADEDGDVIPIEYQGHINNNHPRREELSHYHAHDIYITIPHNNTIQGEQTVQPITMDMGLVSSESGDSSSSLRLSATAFVSATGVTLPSSCLHHPYFPASTYLLLLVISLILSITTSYYLILITYLLTLTLVGNGMMLWIKSIDSQQWNMSSTQLGLMMWRHFTLAFWSMGVLVSVLMILVSLFTWWLISPFTLAMVIWSVGIICPYGLVYPYLIRSIIHGRVDVDHVTPSQLSLDVITAKSMSMGITSATMIFSFHILSVIDYFNVDVTTDTQVLKRVALGDSGMNAIIPVLIAFMIITISFLALDILVSEYLIVWDHLRVAHHHPVSPHRIRRFVKLTLFRWCVLALLLIFVALIVITTWDGWLSGLLSSLTSILVILMFYLLYHKLHSKIQKCYHQLAERDVDMHMVQTVEQHVQLQLQL